MTPCMKLFLWVGVIITGLILWFGIANSAPKHQFHIPKPEVRYADCVVSQDNKLVHCAAIEYQA
jgi:hypothetical protein